MKTWSRTFYDLGDTVVEASPLYFRATGGDGDGNGNGDGDGNGGRSIRPAGKRFVGRLVVLVDATNASATHLFARIVKDNRLGTLVGQPTGGNLRGTNGGGIFFLTLPNSQVEVDIPIYASFPAGAALPDGESTPFVDVPDRGVEPDVHVLPTPDDLRRRRDPELDAAVQVIVRP